MQSRDLHKNVVKNRYGVTIYKEIIFNKIEQGLIYIMSDLVITRRVRL